MFSSKTSPCIPPSKGDTLRKMVHAIKITAYANTGFVFMIASIRSFISCVILGYMSRAFRFSSNCASLVAPRIAVVTLGLLMHQAIANVASDVSSSFAIVSSWRTPAIRSSLIVRSLSHSNPSSARRDPSGTPSLYLPVSNPLASGLQMVVPRPMFLKIRLDFCVG